VKRNGAERAVTMHQPSLFERSLAEESSPEVRNDVYGLFRVVPRFPSFNKICTGDLFSLSLSNNTSTLTHGLHRFAAKYIPQIPAWVLEEFVKEDAVVLDPFCGSGTSLVESLHRCRKSIGLDCDPLAVLIASAKTADISSARIRELGERLRTHWKKPAADLRLPMPGLVNFTHWFSEAAWRLRLGLPAAG